MNITTRVRKEDKVDATNVFAKGALINLKVRAWGASAKLDVTELGIDLEIVRAMNDLIEDKSSLKLMSSIKNEAKRHIQINSLPFPVDGLYFIPKDRVIEVDDYLNIKKYEYTNVLEKFIEQYDELKENFKQKYPNFYKESKYPTKAKLMSMFQFEWTWRTFSVPDEELQMLSPELYRREVEKFKKEINEMKDYAVSTIGRELVQRINNLKDSCFGERRVNQGTINGINDVLEKFYTLWNGFVDDKDLRSIIKDCQNMLDGIDAESIRDNIDLKEAIGRAAGELVKNIKELPNPVVQRALDF